MRSLGLLVVSLIAAGALSGCCTQSCGVGGNGLCCSAGSACPTDCGKSCDSCGSTSPCNCAPKEHRRLLDRLGTRTDCGCESGKCDSGNCGTESGPRGIFGGCFGGKKSCDSCGDQTGNCGCKEPKCDRGALLDGGFRGVGCCNKCGDQTGNCGCSGRDNGCGRGGLLSGLRGSANDGCSCGQSSGNCGCQTGAPCSCGDGRTGLLDGLGSRSSGCGCGQCGGSGGPFKFRSRANGCNNCGSQSGDCGCAQTGGNGAWGSMNGNGSSHGDASGRFGSGGIFDGGVAQSSCDDCANGWGATRAGGIGGNHFAGCGRNGCGMGGHLCSNCRARAMAGLRGRAAAHHPYGGMIPHTPSAQLEGQGPVTPTYVYPYYTTRGPRDFLMPNPPSIGY